jgi:hypothetical protein
MAIDDWKPTQRRFQQRRKTQQQQEQPMEDTPPNFEALMNGEPAVGLKIIMEDLAIRLLRQGVRPSVIQGINIAMQIAYRLGEKAGGLSLLEEDGE